MDTHREQVSHCQMSIKQAEIWLAASLLHPKVAWARESRELEHRKNQFSMQLQLEKHLVSTWHGIFSLNYYIVHHFNCSFLMYRPDCKKQVEGVQFPKYRKFNTLEEAHGFIDQYAKRDRKDDRSKVADFYAVAAGKTPGVYRTWYVIYLHYFSFACFHAVFFTFIGRNVESSSKWSVSQNTKDSTLLKRLTILFPSIKE